MSIAIRLEAVTLRHGREAVLDGLSLSVAAGEVVALVGASGSGKTSILRLVLGLMAPTGGTVLLGDRVASQDGRVLVAPEDRGVAVVFQDLALWPHLTVRGNLDFVLGSRGVARAARGERIGRILERVGLAGKLGRYPGELSGGERQRVAIARALVVDPGAVVLDEPLSSLDPGLRRDLLAMFRELLAERGTTAIYVSHDIREATALGCGVAVLDGGKIVQTGPLELLRRTPASQMVAALTAELG